jgi:hypothetical protein
VPVPTTSSDAIAVVIVGKVSVVEFAPVGPAAAWRIMHVALGQDVVRVVSTPRYTNTSATPAAVVVTPAVVFESAASPFR